MTKNFAVRLRTAREQRGASQQDAARKAGCNISQWSHWEAGSRAPSLENFVKICVSVGVSADELLGLNDPLEARIALIELRIDRYSHVLNM